MKKIYLICAGLALLVASCKKDNNSNNNNNNNLSPDQPKIYIEDIKSPIVGNSTITMNLTYDDKKRMVSRISVSPSYKEIIKYLSNGFTSDLYNNDVLSIHSMLWVGSNSFIDSVYQYNDTNDTTTMKYIYNSANQLTEIKDYDYSNGVSTLSDITTYTYDSAGNVISENGPNGLITHDYYTDLPYTLNLGIFYVQLPKYFEKTLTVDDGGGPETATHTYTFDDKNRLTVDKVVATNGDIITKTYVY